MAVPLGWVVICSCVDIGAGGMLTVYVNWAAAEVAEVRPPTLAVTLTVPLPAGAVALQVVAELQDTAVAALPVPKSKSVVPGVVEKPVPVMVTTVPAGPVSGAISVTVGATAGVYRLK
jgi:hypothetical protein